MLRLLLFAFALLACACLTRAEGPAGIVLYFVDDEQVFLLLADDVTGERGWSAFGGHAEGDETVHQTAARETEEETRGYFARAWLLKKIEGQSPVVSNDFSMFFVEVPFVSALRIAQHPLQNVSAPLQSATAPQRERPHYAWIPLGELERALAANDLAIDPLLLPPTTRRKAFWSVWLANMRAAYAESACPWQAEPEPRP